jgi:NADPH2:quinone reductase
MLKGLTAQFLVHSCFAVQKGQTVLVHAAAGGVGLLLGQWLRLLGATAIGTVGSVDKVATAKANGYAYAIDNHSEDFTARVLEITGGERCDVVYDSVGKDTWRGSLKCLKVRGTFVSFGQSSGPIAEFKILDLAAGSLFASRPMLFDYIKTPQELKARADDLFARLAAGEVKAHVSMTLPLRDAALAHRALASRLTMGSTVLLP